MRVLIAEDEVGLARGLKFLLEKNNFTVDIVHDGADALAFCESVAYDAVVLDIMMPKKDGLTVCRFLRERYDVPVIFLTALDQEETIVESYEIGADEYITKPFSNVILLAKINALINRYRGLVVKDGITRVDELTIEPARRRVLVHERTVTLAPKEYDLLLLLVEHRNHILSRAQILDLVWGADFEGYERTVDNHIKKLRAALGDAGAHIATALKAGYYWKE
jgi:DNA-binding response OmpR family regulator